MRKNMQCMLFLFFTLTTQIGFAQTGHERPSKMTSSDTRKPLLLTEMMAEHQKANMRGHLEALSDLMGAITEKNFKNMADAGKRLGTTSEMTMMCNHMGQATPGFTEFGLKMHSSADKITEAAFKKNLTGVMKAVHQTLQSCTACHSAFKQKIVSELEWNKLSTSGGAEHSNK